MSLDDTNPMDPDIATDFGDDDWDYDEPGRRPSNLIIAAVAGLVVIVLLAFVLTRGGDDSADKTNKGNTTPTTQPKTHDWPSDVKTRPAALGKIGTKPADLPSGAKPGAYLWVDYNGWHLWVIPGSTVGALTGSITSNDRPTKANLLVPDTGVAEIKGNSITFTLKGDAPLTGFDFNPGFYGERLVVVINTAKGPLDVKLIKLGSNGATPKFPIFFAKDN